MSKTLIRGGILFLAVIVACSAWFALEVRAEESAVENPYIGNAEAISEGEELFDEYCSECHGDGTGGTGPDLTDNEWFYGDSDADLYKSVANGRPRGMPAMQYDMNKEELQKVIAFVRSIKK